MSYRNPLEPEMPDLLALVFLACTTFGVGERCELVTLSWDRSPMVCMLQGQAEMTRWFEQHPSWRLRGGWRCACDRDT